MAKAQFPQPFRFNRRVYFRRSEIEHYKKALISEASGATTAPNYVPPEVEHFVSAIAIAKEFAVTRRTIGRRIAGFDRN